MSLRLISKMRRSFILPDGTVIWQMMGAEGEDDPADDQEGTEEDDSDSDDEDGGTSSKKSADAEDAETLRKRMKAADRRAAAAEQKLKEKELAEKSEIEQMQVKLQEAEAANAELNERVQTLQRERYFLGSNTVTWHDPEIAMSKLKWDDIIDEDGDVDQTALERAIKDLAKNKPFLVKSEEPEGENRPPAQGQPSGSKAGTGKKQSKQEMDREALLKKYPALR